MMIFMSWPSACITDFLRDQRGQYLLLTNTFVQDFHFHSRWSPPMVDFYLYDEYKEMTLREFCRVCKLPFPGIIENHILMMWRGLLIQLL